MTDTKTGQRIAMTDSSGRWFNATKAREYPENNWWDGNNHISTATGNPWDHQSLYHTASGAWVLNSWSQWQNKPETYDFVDEGSAYEWLLANDHADAVPPAVDQNHEVQPAKQDALSNRIPAKLYGQLKEHCATQGVNVKDGLVAAIESYLGTTA